MELGIYSPRLALASSPPGTSRVAFTSDVSVMVTSIDEVSCSGSVRAGAGELEGSEGGGGGGGKVAAGIWEDSEEVSSSLSEPSGPLGTLRSYSDLVATSA